MAPKETKSSPSPPESRPDSDLNFRAETWLERAKIEEESPLKLYIEGLGLLAELAGVDPNILPLKRGACGEITIVSEELKNRFSQGYGGYEGEIEKHTEAIALSLGQIDPLIAHPNLIDKAFFGRHKKLSSHKRRLELLKGVGLTEEGKEYPLILALQIRIAAQRAMLKPVVSKVENWTAPRLTVSLDNPEDFFIELLSEPEYYRGFDCKLEETINPYAQKVFGKDAEEALSLWQEFIIPTSTVKRLIEIDRIQQQWAKLLAERNWEEVEEFRVKLMGLTPELFYLEEAKKYISKKGKTKDGTPFQVLRIEKRTHWAGKELPEPRNYIRLEYPGKIGYRGKEHTELMSVKTLINGVDSGEFIFSD